MEEPTADERRRSTAMVQREMLISLWAHVLGDEIDPDAECMRLAERTTATLESVLDELGGRDATVTAPLARQSMDNMWLRVRLALATPEGSGPRPEFG